MNPLSFITGSRRYGQPVETSDVDFVVFTSKQDADILLQLADDSETGSETIRKGSYSLYFGQMNLIVCWCEETYNVWLTGTTALYNKRPVTRDEAISVFHNLRGFR